MIDEAYSPKTGQLVDDDIMWLCLGDNPMISPFISKQMGDVSFGLSTCGYDFRLGANYLAQEETIQFDLPVDPLNKEHQELQWIKKEAKDGIIVIRPLECLLLETVETINMPKDVAAIVLGKSTYCRNNLALNTSPLEPKWKGKITLEMKNYSPIYSVKLRVGQGIAQGVFSRLSNVPARGYDEREAGGRYQNQKGVTTSK